MTVLSPLAGESCLPLSSLPLRERVRVRGNSSPIEGEGFSLPLRERLGEGNLPDEYKVLTEPDCRDTI
jgi:hypothetical protein